MNRGQRIGTFASVIISAFLLIGCDLKEIDTFSTVLSIGIDRNNDGTILLTMEISNFSKSKSMQQKMLMISGTGQSIEDAERNIQLKNPLELYQAHNALILLGESYARHNVHEVADFFQRNPTFRPTMFLAVCQGRAKDVLRARVSTESINALGIREMINEASRRSLTSSSEMIRWVKDLHHRSHTFQLAALKLDMDAKPEVSGVGLFYHNQLVRWITTKQVPFLLLLTERQISHQLIKIIDANHNAIYIQILWANVIPSIKVAQGKLVVVYNVLGESEIVELSHEMALPLRKIVVMENKVNSVISARTKQMIHSLQKDKIDGINLADILYREHHNLYQRFSLHWEDEFAQADITCHFSIRLIRTGLLN